MKSEYALGNMRIHFESRARRRWFVAFFYTVLAVFDLAGFSVSAKNAASAWISAGCMILFVALCLVFTWLAGDMRARGDEREMYRRDHAHFRAYRFFLYVLMGAIFFAPIREPNPLASPVPLALRGILVQPNFLAVSALLLYMTLPQAILLWTEPDMEPEIELARL
jgi:hypothetical protein